MSRCRGLWLLAFLALALRVAALLVLYRSGEFPQTYEHGEIARNLLAGRGFSVTFLGVEGPTSQQAPWMPSLLALAYACCGVDSEQAIWFVQSLQCLAGVGLVLTVVWLAWSLVPERESIGWIAGVGAAIYPPHIYMVTHVQVVVWAAFALTLLLAIVAWPRARGNWRWAIAAGGVAGWLLLIEPILALALPLAAAAFTGGYLRREPRRAVVTFSAMTLTTLAIVAPWLVRNYLVHGELVFIKSTFGYAFWQGNHPISWGTDKIPKPEAEQLRATHDGTFAGRNAALWQARHETLYIDDVVLKPERYARFQGLSEPARSRLLGTEAWWFVRSDPLRYLQLCAQRLRFFLIRDLTNPKAADPLYRISSALWLLSGVVGLAAGRAYWRRWWLSGSLFLVVTVFHAATIVSARFRIPLEPMTFVWCATGVAWFGQIGLPFRHLSWSVNRRAEKRSLSATSGS